MVMKCCVPNCKMTCKEVKMHRFPYLDELVYNRWIKNIGRKDLQDMDPRKVHKNYRVCHEHFSQDVKIDPEKYSSQSHLVSGACPTLLMPQACEMEEEQEASASTVTKTTTSTFGKQGVVLHSQAREIVANVIDFMKTEAEHFRRYNTPLIPMTNFRERVLAATKISRKIYTSVTKEAEDVASGVSTSFTSPTRKRTRIEKDDEVVEDADINIKNEYTQHEEEPNVDEHENVCIKKVRVFIKEENDETEEPNVTKTELEDSQFFDNPSSINGSYLDIKTENIEPEETLDTSLQENDQMKEKIKEKIEIEECNLLGPRS